MNWELIKECIDNILPFQSKGNPKVGGKSGTYYLKIETNLVRSEKYDADCIAKKMNLNQRIADNIFRLINNQNTKESKLILVETKGKDQDYFQQLHQTLNLFKNFEGNIHGRFVGFGVPSSFTKNKKLKEGVIALSKKFSQKNGSLRYFNRVSTETIKSYSLSELKGENINQKAVVIKL
jgi:ribosomal protein L22